MANKDFTIDHRGARGSGTGDEYHELWAVRQALRLLELETDLLAVTVEGVPASDGAEAAWDGVDCGLLFGGYGVETATCIEWQQLKYSAAAPDKAWSVARLATGKNGKPSSSPIRRLADAYAKTMAKRSTPLQSLKIAFVSNQPIASDLVEAIDAARTNVPSAYRSAWKPGDPDLHRLVHASGLKPAEFKQFALALDLQGRSGSRFASEEKVLEAVSQWSDVEFVETAQNLRQYVRQRMKPESAGEVIDKEKVLFQFGVSDERALFPCPGAISIASNPVPRATPSAIVQRMQDGQQFVCMHGGAGVGKTTALQQIQAELPEGSHTIVFDCYGAGSYQDASALRHKPEDAFLHLCNELARSFRAPLLLEPRSTRDYVRAFRKRLQQASALLAGLTSDALLLIAIDAADNSVTAANERTPPERTFVHDFVSLDDLPANVRFLVSARTGRKSDLRLPQRYKEIELPAFVPEETRANVARYWDAPVAWAEDFHHLSSGVPRVQAYAFDTAPTAPADAINALRPLGKKLHQVFEEQFNLALKKAGRANELQRVCAGLTVLARPIPIAELAAVLQYSETQVADICADLAPGVRNHEGNLRFADEDFEGFVREAAARDLQDVQQRAADRFLQRAYDDEYAAYNVAPALLAAGRRTALLDFVEQFPEPDAQLIRDPVRRREVQLQRLLTAIKACRDSGDAARALRFVLIGAEAIGTDAATRDLLANFPQLAARYAKETAGRLILGDPDRVQQHGALLFETLALDAGNQDAIAYREDRRRLQAWEQARQDAAREDTRAGWAGRAWEIDGEQGAAYAYAILRMEGAAQCAHRILRFRSASFALDSGRSLLERLLAERRFEDIDALSRALPTAWSLFPAVGLASVGQPVDLDRLASALRLCNRRLKLGTKTLGHSTAEDALGPYLADTMLSAAEFLAGNGRDIELVREVLAPFLDPAARRVDRVRDFENNHIDAILRAYCLAERLDGRAPKIDEVLTPRPPPEDGRQRPHHHSENDRNIGELISSVGAYYAARAHAMVTPREKRTAAFETDLASAHGQYGKEAWRLDRKHATSGIKIKIGNSLLLLVGLGVDPNVILTAILDVRRGAWSGFSTTTGSVFKRLPALAGLHEQLVGEISRAALEARRERAGADDKSRTLAAYATLLIPMSGADADLVFKQAIEVASELDSEAVDQLKLIDALVARGAADFGAEARTTAETLAEVAQDAGIRLENVEHFPWSAVFSAIARLDLPTAMAAAARWDDTNTLKLDRSLPAVIEIGRQTGALTKAQASGLLALLGRADADDLAALLKTPDRDIAEELSRDLIGDRIKGGNRLSEYLAQCPAGPWTELALAAIAFERGLPSKEQEPPIRQEKPAKQSRANSMLQDFAWDEATLSSAERLEEAIERIRCKEKENDGYIVIAAILEHARASVPFRARLAHLDALLDLLDRLNTGDVLEALLVALAAWSGQGAVAQWAKAKLPHAISAHLPLLARYLPWNDSLLLKTLSAAGADDAGVQAMMLEGIEIHADHLSSSVTFALAQEVARRCTPTEAVGLCRWYVQRLVARVHENDLERISDLEIPGTADDAVARLIWASLGDIDVRQRWRGAHALRRMARLDQAATLKAIVAQYSRQHEPAFRDPTAPFYWVAARLWLIIALDRIAGETPAAAAPFGSWLLDVATSEDFPHMLLRDYAADAVRKLVSARALSLNATQTKALKRVNKSVLPRGRKKSRFDRSFNGPIGSRAENPRRFHFDGMDTLRYWYEPWLRAFEDLEPEQFLQAAEHWIVDVWGVADEPPYGSKEPRKRRFSERDWHLSRNGHGSLPTIETHRSHLEWHAMWCAAGQCLRTHRISKADYPGDNEVRQQLDYDKLSDPEIWTADLAGPKPLETHFWHPRPPKTEWMRTVADEHFLRETLPESRPGYVTVDAFIVTKWGGREDNIRVRSALVSPLTAPALVRALQTIDDPFDYYLCPEGHELEIDERDYKLLGWLRHKDGDPGFDKRDPFSNGLSRVDPVPGDRLGAHFLYRRSLGIGQIEWTSRGQRRPAFVHHAWAAREREESRHHYGDDADSRGERLLVRADHLQEFLKAEGMDLLIEVGVSRRDEKRSSGDDDEENESQAEFDRIFHFRADGSIGGAEQDFGSWLTNRSRARDRRSQRHTQPLDGASSGRGDVASGRGQRRRKGRGASARG